MVVAAETLRFCGNSSVLDNALLHWFAQGEQFKNASIHSTSSERISYLSSKNGSIPQFNVYRLQARWQELLEKSDLQKLPANYLH